MVEGEVFYQESGGLSCDPGEGAAVWGAIHAGIWYIAREDGRETLTRSGI